MSDKGLSSLTAATSHSTTDLLYAVIGGNSRKITIESFSASQTFPDGSLSAPGIRFTDDTNTGIYRAAADTIGIVEGGVNIARSVTLTSPSNPNVESATGRMFAMLNEDWRQKANAHWIVSDDLTIYPGHVTVAGVWLAGDIAKVRINTGGTNYDFSHTVQSGGTSTSTIASALRALIVADATLAAIPVYVQAVSSSGFDLNFQYAQYPITLSNLSTTAGGSLTLTQPSNILDGPVGLHIQRGLNTARTPVAEDNIGAILWWAPYDSGGNSVTYARIDAYIDNPALASLVGRMQFLTGDSSVSDALNRMILRKGLYLTTSTGASPSGGTAGDMGAGTINTPDSAGYYCNGNGYLRANGNNIQLINENGTGVLQFGTNATARLNIAADGTSIHPETDGGPSLGTTSRRFATGYFSGLVIAAVASAALAFGGLTTASQALGSSEATSSQTLALFSSTGSQFPALQFYRSKNATVGSATVVADGDVLGAISWLGAQQTGTFATQNPAARIRAEVDGTVTSGAGGDMPGRIVWSTTADGSGTLTDRLILDSSGVLKPASDGGATLGTTTLGYAHLHINTGGTINWEGGDVVITHAGNTLTFSGASSGYNFDALATISLGGVGLRVVNTTDNATVQVARFEGDRATMADNDEAYIALMLSDDGGTQTEFARITWAAPDVNTGTSVDGRIDLAVATAGALADELSLTGAALFPSSNGGLALGIASTNEFSGLNLLEGGAINWDNGDVTVTQTGNLLAFAGATTAYTFDSPVVVGHTTALTILTATDRRLQIYGSSSTSSTNQSLAIGMYGTNATDQPHILFYRSRSATVGASTVVQDGDALGGFFWVAAQETGGSNTQSLAAGLTCEVDGTVTGGTSGDMPTRMLFKVSTDGSADFAERMRITNQGCVRITGSLGLGSPVTKTADFTLATTENHIINNRAATNTVTLPAASAFPGRMLFMKTIQAQTVVSASSNVVPSTSATAGTAILPATDGAWALLVSDATNWIIMAANPLV